MNPIRSKHLHRTLSRQQGMDSKEMLTKLGERLSVLRPVSAGKGADERRDG
jgi:hypothetical protein